MAGYSFFYTGEFEKSLNLFVAAYELDESDGSNLTWGGDAARMMENLELALTLYNKAIEIDESQAWAFFGRGLVFQAAGNQSRAKADFEHAEQLQRGITNNAPRGSSVRNTSSSSLIPTNTTPTNTAQRPVTQANNSIVGTWVCDVTVNNVPTRVVVEFDAQGNYAMAIKAQYTNGYSETTRD